MFEQNVGRAARPWTMACAIALQASVVAAAAIVPMLRLEPMPQVKLVARRLAPPHMKLVQVPERVRQQVATGLTIERVVAVRRAIQAPTRVPDRVGDSMDASALLAELPESAVGNEVVVGMVLERVVVAPKPVPVVAVAKPKPALVVEEKTYTVGGDVRAPVLKVARKPEYPVLAKRARIQGVVRLRGVIAKDGAVRSLELLSGHPLLVGAAMEAVRTWEYEPGRLNGRPVDVQILIDVNFTLAP